MKNVFLVALTLMLGSTNVFAMGKAIPSKTGNHCRDEGTEWLLKKFEGKVTVKSIYHYKQSDQGAATQTIWFYTDACNGAILMDFMAVKEDCTAAVWGQRPERLLRIYATDQCKDLIPSDEYPISLQ